MAQSCATNPSHKTNNRSYKLQVSNPETRRLPWRHNSCRLACSYALPTSHHPDDLQAAVCPRWNLTRILSNLVEIVLISNFLRFGLNVEIFLNRFVRIHVILGSRRDSKPHRGARATLLSISSFRFVIPVDHKLFPRSVVLKHCHLKRRHLSSSPANTPSSGWDVFLAQSWALGLPLTSTQLHREKKFFFRLACSGTLHWLGPCDTRL